MFYYFFCQNSAVMVFKGYGVCIDGKFRRHGDVGRYVGVNARIGRGAVAPLHEMVAFIGYGFY